MERKRACRPSVAILGCGQLGRALACALSAHCDLHLFGRSGHEANEQLASRLPAASVHRTATSALQQAEWLFFTCKPDQFDRLAHPLGADLHPYHKLVSWLASRPCRELRQSLPCPPPPLFRAMTSLCCRQARAPIALYGEAPSAAQSTALEELLMPMGPIHWIDEELFHGFTLLVASSPALIATLLEAAVDSAVAMGFDYRIALDLLLETTASTTALLQQEQLLPAQLKWQIASPSGVTISALRALEAGGGRSALIEALLSGYEAAVARTNLSGPSS